MKFGLDNSKPQYLREILFGKPDNQKYDGYHLNGQSASRHFTYRAIQAIRPITSSESRPANQSGTRGRNIESGGRENFHRDCPQSRYMRKNKVESHQGNRKFASYAESVKQRTSDVGYAYSVPTQNRFNPLN